MNPLEPKPTLGDAFFSFTRSDLFLKLILLFPIATLLQHHFGFLNKLLFGAVLMVLLCVKQLPKKPLVYLGGTTLLWLVSVLFTPSEAFGLNLNMTFYYIFLVYYFVYMVCNQDHMWQLLQKNRRYIYYVVLIYTAIVTVSIFLPSSYTQMTAGGWGDEAYFVSISGSPNRVGPAAVFILVLLTFLVRAGIHKSIFLLSLPHLYTVLMGGSRTYFVLGLCVFLVLYYSLFRDKKWFYLSLIPLAAAAMVVILKSNMMNKFAATFQAGQGLSKEEFLRRLTNTRSVFWVEQLKLFFDTPWYKQLFGNGINFTTYRYGLWAHSDFIEILCSYGYIGLANYVGLMFFTIHSLLKRTRKHFLIKCVCVFIWFFNAFINFFYCYFCAMLCYPILLMVVQHFDDSHDTDRSELPS